ncbi:S-adenosyl-L-methionine-dependent methyltransferase [Cystobasidium minutum MCA 4210]|uniref:S-adenosyl-L-methionine-dependent methyltransferase n=1 Tax=Cystobasidium minutum MCA 4210 TaxID=1397322 RepID=UPI0034CE8DD5|eukprot:jgi/Rhomi1/6238/CE6237_3412
MASTTASRSLRSLRSALPCNICGGGGRAGRSTFSVQARSYATPISAASSSSSSSTTSSSSSGSSTSNIPNPSAYAVFDRATKIKQKNRAVQRDVEHSRLTDYVKDEVAANLVERLLDIKKRYPVIVDFGSGAGHIVKHLDREITQKVIMCDSAQDLLYRDSEEEYDVDVERIVLDEENFSPHTLKPDSQDVIMSNLALHWVNDLPGTLIQIRHTLKEDGAFIGALLGGDTLFELRTALQLAELEREGGISPRVSPMTDSRSMSSLLSRAGFNLPAVDVDEITINYPSIFELIDDLRFMGESNAVGMRRTHLKRDTLLAADAIYRALHGNEDGTIPATFQIIFAIGWKPAASQPKPLKRGSAKTSLKEALGEGPPEGQEGSSGSTA